MRFHQRYPMVLASGSPRRKDYLHRFHLSFRTLTSHISEAVRPGELPLDYAVRMAVEKLDAVLPHCRPEEIVLAADTIVILNDHILGKPTSPADAHSMLAALSGQTHRVITAYRLLHRESGQDICKHAITDVTFKEIPAVMIHHYIASDEPFDKAGSYSLQDKGTLFIQSINGSYNNVIGLPIEMVMEDLFEQMWVTTV